MFLYFTFIHALWQTGVVPPSHICIRSAIFIYVFMFISRRRSFLCVNSRSQAKCYSSENEWIICTNGSKAKSLARDLSSGFFCRQRETKFASSGETI